MKTNAKQMLATAKNALHKFASEWNTPAEGNYVSYKEILNYSIGGMGRDMVMNLTKYLGLGISWWEPAWLPLQGVGWSKAGTKPSWSDQALFSYDGVKLPSLDTFTLLEETKESKNSKQSEIYL